MIERKGASVEMEHAELQSKIDLLNKKITECNNIVFFGGAGVSTASGIPDFRSKDGLYNKVDINFSDYNPEYLLSRDCLDKEPKVFFEFFRQKLDTRNIKPNVTHYKLAELENAGKLKAVITQNIDGLHQKAGSKVVYEIHGTAQTAYCTKCGKEFSADYILDSKDDIPVCDKCGGIVRPDVTLYGESLPAEAMWRAKKAITLADMVIIAGTSLAVYPAASLVTNCEGKFVVLINKGKVESKVYTDLVIDYDMTEVFRSIIVE